MCDWGRETRRAGEYRDVDDLHGGYELEDGMLFRDSLTIPGRTYIHSSSTFMKDYSLFQAKNKKTLTEPWWNQHPLVDKE